MEQTIYNGFAAKLRARRAECQLSQQELAGQAGLTRSAVANMEAGRQGVLLHHIYALARAMQCEPGSLLPDVASEQAKESAAPRRVELFVASLSALRPRRGTEA